MKERYRSPKGFQDIIPPEAFLWDYIERTAVMTFLRYGYHEMRVPVVEHTEVFTRSIGENTDIVEKEMYTFTDRAGRSLTLRPEGTAPVVRSYVQNGLFTRPAPQKVFYRGPMFRYERPQKGRFRQFYQIGAEAFGVDDPIVDAELLALLRDFFSAVGVRDLTFEVNSIGCTACRPAYRVALQGFIAPRSARFCTDCRRRYDANPLRVLDCKVPGCVEASSGAPELIDFLCEDCGKHFRDFREYLDDVGMPYLVNARLVRGLDYYTSTTFEATTTKLGAQKAVAAGGRYNRLVEEFGGPATPAVGFALGMERVAELVALGAGAGEPNPSLFVAALSAAARRAAFRTVLLLRERGVWCELNYSGASLGNLMKKADRMGARYVFIIGDDELASGRLTYRRLSDGSEGNVPIEGYDEMVRLVT